ncbi:MAG: hypothetical protein C4524_02740 [Candidatus Zixiibacteriota bacterium]|nr:MAG: hypothetical protein C4524_02740 [candidate division Zixibacteria bacterium]
MRILKFGVFLFLGVALLVVAGILAWPRLRVDDRLRQALLDQATPHLPGLVGLTSAHLDWGRIELRGVSLRDSVDRWSVAFPAARVNLSLYRFLTHGFSPLQAISEIILEEPRVDLSLPPGDSTRAEGSRSDSASITEVDWDFLDRLPEAVWLRRVALLDGILILKTAGGDTLLTLPHLDLTLNSPRPGTAAGRVILSGGSDGNSASSLKLSLDRRARTLEAGLTLDWPDLKLGREIGLPDTLSLSLDSLQVSLRMWARGKESGMEGEILLRRLGLADHDDGLMMADSLRLVLGGWRLSLPEARIRGLNAEWQVQGQIADLRDPKFDFHLDLQAKDAARLTSGLAGRLPVQPSGPLDLSLTLNGTPASPQIYFRAGLGSLETGVERLHQVSVAGEYSERRIILNLFRARSAEAEISAQGDILLVQPYIRVNADFRILGRLPGAASLLPGTLTGQLHSTSDGYQARARWRADEGTDPVTVTADYSPAEKRLEARVEIPQTPSWAEVTVERLFDDPTYRLQVSDPAPLLRQVIAGAGAAPWNTLSLQGSAQGTLRRTDFTLEAGLESSALSLRLGGVLQARSLQSLDLDARLALQKEGQPPFEGRVLAAWADSVLTLTSLELDGAIFAHGSLDLKTGEIGPNELRIAGWNLNRARAWIATETSPAWGGILDGRVEAFGSLANPGADLNLYASRGYFQEQGDFWAVVSAQLENRRLEVTECSIGRSGSRLLQAQGGANFADTTIQVSLLSELEDVSTALDLFAGNPARIHGPMRLNASLGGTFAHPEMDLALTISPGVVYKVPFDSISAHLRLDESTNRALIVQDFRAVQSPDLLLEAGGILPYNGNPLDLQFRLAGNILKILHQIEKDILESRGHGELLVEIGQADGKVQLESAHLELHDGLLRFGNVVDEIRGLRGDLYFKDHRLVIRDVAGEIAGQTFHLRNAFAGAEHSFGHQPLYFRSLDLDLGVLILETGGRGIYANIPSLMVEGTKGYLRFTGHNGSPRFMVGGPVDRPVFSGSVTISGATVTYPFPPGSGRPSRFVRQVIKVLTSAEWDLNVIPERDNRYFIEVRPLEERTLLADVSDLLAQVDVDLTMDASESRLKVLGCLDEESFRLAGDLVSTQGSVEYLDLQFRVDRFEAEFDESDPYPWVQGRASTFYQDTLGFNRDIYLTLYVIDPVTKERQLRGRWGEIVFILEDDAGSSQEQILAALGYSPGAITEKMTSLGGTILSNTVMRSLIRPIERRLETVLQVDVIRLQPTLAQNVFEAQVLGITPDPGQVPVGQVAWGAYFLRHSKLVVGKYLSDDVFVNYSGTWNTGIDARNERHFGFLHLWNLDYYIRPISGNLILTLGYEYDSLEKLDDKRVSLRYSFVF